MPGATVVNMSDPVAPLNYGFFGKVPSAGDFVSRDIPHHYLRRIDDWFSKGMSSLSAEQQTWLDVYLTAPVWNFVIAPKVWGNEFLYGALMPSVDSVGRYFPFITFLKGASLTDVDPVLVSYLPSLANELPVLLQGNLSPNEICHFLAVHVRAEIPALDLFAAPDVNEPCTNRSYWWQSPHDSGSHTLIVHHGSPDQQLFKQLFFDFQSPSPKATAT